MNIKKLGLLAVSILTVSTLTACSTPKGGDVADPAMTAFAQCLTEKGVTMYGTTTCPYCQKQKERFGSAFENVNYVDCQEDPDACTEKGIEGIPAWIFANGSMKQGLQDLKVLADSAGCKLSTVDSETKTGNITE